MAKETKKTAAKKPAAKKPAAKKPAAKKATAKKAVAKKPAAKKATAKKAAAKKPAAKKATAKKGTAKKGTAKKGTAKKATAKKPAAKKAVAKKPAAKKAAAKKPAAKKVSESKPEGGEAWRRGRTDTPSMTRTVGRTDKQGELFGASQADASASMIHVEKAPLGKNYILVIKSERKLMSTSEMSGMVAISKQSSGSKGMDQLFKWLKQHREDILTDAQIRNNNDPVLLQLLDYLNSHFSL